MSVAKWTTPSTRSSNFASTVFNSLANGSESSTVTYDNSTNKDLYAAVTLKLGSITPSTGGSVTLRVIMSDGTDTSNTIGGDLYVIPLTSGASAKINITPLVRLYPFSLRFSLVNNSGVSLAASGNEIYVTPFNEDIV
jgi:hypothetical protein